MKIKMLYAYTTLLGAQFEQAVKAYEKKYGPLMNFGHSSSDCPFQWVDDPWPWQKEYYE